MTRGKPTREICEALGVGLPDDAQLDLAPTWNLAPSQATLLLVAREATPPVIAPAVGVWGFAPGWSTFAQKPINARCETVATSPLFRGAFREGRCLVPVTGYYEWEARAGGPKQPHHFTPIGTAIALLAGVCAEGKDGRLTFAVVTTEAMGMASTIHDRAPVVVPAKRAQAWLSRETRAEVLDALMRPPTREAMHAQRVGRAVNSVKNDGPELLAWV